MEKIKRASILIPVYNVEDTLERCVDSALSQTWPDTEIILVNDGSTDSSPSICREYAKKHPCIKVIDQKNGGLATARNTSLKVATGDYIFFLDSDDYVDPSFVEKPIKALERNEADICIFGFISSFVDEGKKKIHNAGKEKLLSKEEAMKGLLKDGYINNLSWNKCYKKELFEGISFPDGRVFEDIATTYRLFDKAEKICIIPDILHSYEIRTESVSYKWWKNEKKAEDYFDARLSQLEYMNSRYPGLSSLAYASAGHGALVCALNTEKNIGLKTKADDFLKDHEKELKHTAFPFGLLFRVYYTFPVFVRNNKDRFGL